MNSCPFSSFCLYSFRSCSCSCAQVGWQMLPFHWMAGSMNTHALRLPESLWGVALWLAVSFVLYRKKVFVTV